MDTVHRLNIAGAHTSFRLRSTISDKIAVSKSIAWVLGQFFFLCVCVSVCKFPCAHITWTATNVCWWGRLVQVLIVFCILNAYHIPLYKSLNASVLEVHLCLASSSLTLTLSLSQCDGECDCEIQSNNRATEQQNRKKPTEINIYCRRHNILGAYQQICIAYLV